MANKSSEAGPAAGYANPDDVSSWGPGETGTELFADYETVFFPTWIAFMFGENDTQFYVFP
jgi:hypothetical protein